MTTYNTGNPIGSTEVKDLYDNAQNFDTLSTTTTLEAVPDRLGVPRMTFHGFEQAAGRSISAFEQASGESLSSFEQEATTLIDLIKFQPPIPYAPGIDVTTSSLTVDYLGVIYYALPSALPFTTGAWNPAQWSPVQNTYPGQELLVFEDYASASSAAVTLPDGQTVSTVVNDATINYVVASGSLVQITQREGDGPLNVRKFITSQIDGTTSNQSGIVAAVASAFASGADLEWPRGTYVSDGNIPNFWNVNHIGPGVIKRGASTFFVTPKQQHTNILYVKNGGTSGGDCLDEANATTFQQAINRLAQIDYRAGNGVWRIQLVGSSGTIVGGGVKLQGETESLPYFKNPLEIFGDEVALTAEPTTVWDGGSGGEPYAFRMEHTSTVVNLRFRNIKFTNWNRTGANAPDTYPSGSQGGAVLVWNAGTVILENIWADNVYVGTWLQNCRVRQTYGKISRFVAYGASASYLSKFNFGALGGLASGGIDFVDGASAQAIMLGRNSVGYVQGCRFNNVLTCIDVNRLTRVRTQANNFESFTYTAVNVTTGSVWTPDNGAGYPDQYPSLSRSALAYRAESGAAHIHYDRMSRPSLHGVSEGLVAVSGTPGTAYLLSDPAFHSGDLVKAATWVPFRLPAYFWWSPSASMSVEVSMNIPANSGGVLSLNGAAPGAAAQLAAVTIPSAAQARVLRATIRVLSYTSSVSRFVISIPELGINVQGNSASLTSASLRANSEDILLHRLYWTPADSGATQFYVMRSYVEA